MNSTSTTINANPAGSSTGFSTTLQTTVVSNTTKVASDDDVFIPNDEIEGEYKKLGRQMPDPGAMRRKLNELFASKEITLTEFLRRHRVNSNSYGRFMKLKGRDNGYQNGIYWAAARFFLRRLRNEKNAKTAEKAAIAGTKRKAVDTPSTSNKKANTFSVSPATTVGMPVVSPPVSSFAPAANSLSTTTNNANNINNNTTSTSATTPYTDPTPAIASVPERAPAPASVPAPGVKLSIFETILAAQHKAAATTNTITNTNTNTNTNTSTNTNSNSNTNGASNATLTAAHNTPAPTSVASTKKPAKQSVLQEYQVYAIDKAFTPRGPVYEDCDEVRRKIFTFLQSTGISKAAFCDLISCNANTLAQFLGRKGKNEGAALKVYPCAFQFFESIRIAKQEPKSAHYVRIEKAHPEGLPLENPPTRMWVFMGSA